MIRIVETTEDNPMSLTKPQRQKWEFIVNKKGPEYLLTALGHAFKRADRAGFDRFLQNLFMELIKDYNAGQQMRDGKEDEVPEYEVAAEQAPAPVKPPAAPAAPAPGPAPVK